MTRKELIAEVKTSLKQYTESNLIDDISLKLWLKNELKRFGTNIMVLNETVLQVENGISDLPENFWNLDFAVKCSPESYELEKGSLEEVYSASSYWTQRIENTYSWDNQSGSHKKEAYKEVIEKKYFGNNTTVNFRYSGLTLLKLTRGVKKDHLSTFCKSISNKINSPYEINILGNKVQTNFTKGFIYIRYNGLPVDEEGEIYIQDSGHLFTYIVYYLQRRALEDIWLNGDDPDLVNKISYLTQKEKEYFPLAMTQLKFEGLGDWHQKMKLKIRKETNKFERMFPNI